MPKPKGYGVYDTSKMSKEKLRQDVAYLLDEYHFLCRELTKINNIIQPLWTILRERQGEFQSMEDCLRSQEIKENKNDRRNHKD